MTGIPSSSFHAADRLGRINPSPSTAAAARVRELKAAGRRILDLVAHMFDILAETLGCPAGIQPEGCDTQYQAKKPNRNGECPAILPAGAVAE